MPEQLANLEQPPPRRGARLLLAACMAGVMLSSASAEPQPAPDASVEQFDVVVDGAGPGGIAASIQAARMGTHVALLEPTAWIGGQMVAAGVGTMDEGNSVVRKSGLYGEFAQKAMNYYTAQGRSFNTCYYGGNNLCVDPKDGQEILNSMLRDEPRIRLFTSTPVTQVVKRGNAVSGVIAGGKRFAAKVVIDAGEYGDTLAKAGANYRIGNGTCLEPNEKACIQNITYVGIIKAYPEGIPPNLRFTQPPPGYSEAQAKGFARFITPNGNSSQVRPKNPLSFQAFASYRGLPDLSNPQNYDVYQQNGHTITRTALIAGNDYPGDAAKGGVLSYKFLTDPAYRQNAICAAAKLTLDELYYIQHDLGLSWSLANDEGHDRAHKPVEDCPELRDVSAFTALLPPIPYVRESRRLIGQQTLSGNAVQYAYKDRSQLLRIFNSVAVSYYPMDVHGCKKPADLEVQYDAPSNLPVGFVGGSFDIPLGVFIPAEGPDGLLGAEKNISASRLAAGAIREHAPAMATGQAVGALAALAARGNVPPRSVPYQQVQAALRQTGAVTGIR